jgi:hypothetical protein
MDSADTIDMEQASMYAPREDKYGKLILTEPKLPIMPYPIHRMMT